MGTFLLGKGVLIFFGFLRVLSFWKSSTGAAKATPRNTEVESQSLIVFTGSYFTNRKESSKMLTNYPTSNLPDASLVDSYRQFLLDYLTSSKGNLYSFDFVDHRQDCINFTSNRLIRRFYNFLGTFLFGNHWQRHFQKEPANETLLVAIPSHPQGNRLHWHGFLRIKEDVCFACVFLAVELAARATFGAQVNLKLQKVYCVEGKIRYVLFQDKSDSGRSLPNHLLDFAVFLPDHRKERC